MSHTKLRGKGKVEGATRERAGDFWEGPELSKPLSSPPPLSFLPPSTFLSFSLSLCPSGVLPPARQLLPDSRRVNPARAKHTGSTPTAQTRPNSPTPLPTTPLLYTLSPNHSQPDEGQVNRQQEAAPLGPRRQNERLRRLRVSSSLHQGRQEYISTHPNLLPPTDLIQPLPLPAYALFTRPQRAFTWISTKSPVYHGYYPTPLSPTTSKYERPLPSKKLALFDLDGCVIKPKTKGETFPKSALDWTFFHPIKVQEKIRKCFADG